MALVFESFKTSLVVAFDDFAEGFVAIGGQFEHFSDRFLFSEEPDGLCASAFNSAGAFLVVVLELFGGVVRFEGNSWSGHIPTNIPESV